MPTNALFWPHDTIRRPASLRTARSRWSKMCFARSAILAPSARHKLISIGSARSFDFQPVSILRPPALASRMAQCGFEAFLFLVPPGIFGLRFLLESLHLDLDSRGFLRVLPLGRFQRCLRLVDGPLASFTLPLA